VAAACLYVAGAKADVAPVEPSADGAGVYQIGSAANLVWFSDYVNAGNYTAEAVLTADIDMSDVDNFTPIGKAVMDNTAARATCFRGKFDGQGHTIRNLTIVGAADGNISLGLFSRIYSTSSSVKNLFMEHVNISTPQTTAVSIGPIVGHLDRFTLINCGVIDVTISHPNFESGNPSTARDGGVCGYLVSHEQSNLVNCYTDYATYAGKGSKAIITNSYAKSDFDTKASTGELCYLLNGDQSNIVWKQTLGTDAYPVLDATHGTVYGNAAYQCDGVTAKGEISYSNVDASTVDPHTFNDGFCTVCGHCDPAYLTTNGEAFFEIGDKQQLKWFAAYVNEENPTAKARLTAAIDVEEDAWTPMEDFTGTLDGNNFTIYNLGAPLFKTTKDGATIKNLTLNGSLTSTQNRFGAFICDHLEGQLTITNCVNQTAITSKNDRSGGFIGNVSAGTVNMTDCENMANLTSTITNLAGIIGDTSASSTTLTRCNNTGSITGLGDVSVQMAGIVGTFRGGENSTLRLVRCGNSGAIEGKKNSNGNSNVGGLVAWVNSQSGKVAYISNCYNIAPVVATGNFVGGLAGQISKLSSLVIEDSYNTGDVVSDGTDVYMLCGRMENAGNGTVTNCWNSGTARNAASPLLMVDGNNITNSYNVNTDGKTCAQGAATLIPGYEDSWLASGAFTYYINNAAGKTVYYQTLGSFPTPWFTGQVVYKTSDAGWGTFFDTEKAYAFTGVKAYTGKIDGSVLKLTEVSQANAGTPVILEGTYYNKVAKATPAEMPENDLKGTATDLAADGSQYVLAKKDDVVGFYQATEGTIAAGKAYLTGISAGVKAITFGTIDGIVSPLGETEEGAAIYDLSGRRVEKATKGLYIINGKKILK
jgi:hypothetical protein